MQIIDKEVVEVRIEGTTFTINRSYFRGCLQWAIASDGDFSEDIEDREELAQIIAHLEEEKS